MSFHVPEKFRITRGSPLASSAADGNNGAFVIPTGQGIMRLRAIASDGAGWEHVSVSTYSRVPNWREMCLIKDLFWDHEDTVVQFHPPRDEYVNTHPFTLHLWRPVGEEMRRPHPSLGG